MTNFKRFKVERIIDRQDGSQVKITAEVMHGSGLSSSIGYYALHRNRPNQEWSYLSDRAKKSPTGAGDFVTTGEILGTGALLMQ